VNPQIIGQSTPASGTTAPAEEPAAQAPATVGPGSPAAQPREVGGREGPDPTRYGDWEKNGRCIDF
jgi:hypothetical protein